jgi:hypothetical protein
MFRQAQRQLLDAHAPLRRPLLGRRNHFDRRHDAGHIAEPQRADATAQLAVGTVARIEQHDAERHARRAGRTDLLERDLGLGFKLDRRGNMRLLATRRGLGPVPRQIQPIGDRQAGMMIGDRQRHRHLTIGLFAELAAILVMHADRVLALFGERRVIDNPDLDRAVTLDLRNHHLTHLGQHLLVRPR